MAGLTLAGFPRDRRILDSPAYRSVFRSNRRVVGNGFVVFTATSPKTVSRLGQAIAKRKIAHAVDRNRIKRVVRESFRHWSGPREPLDVVVTVRTNASTLSNIRLFEDLDWVWRQLERAPSDGDCVRSRVHAKR